MKQFAERLCGLTRKGDTLSRIGGDEFTIITSKLASPTSARKLAERIMKALNTPYSIDEKVLTSTVSIGIAMYPLDGIDTDELLKNADIAMYKAKKSGKHTYRFYTEELSAAQCREADIEMYLREALDKNELTLYYQPQYNLVTKEIVGAEIQLRWHHEKLGEISPKEFFAIAENSSLILRLGNWILQKTIEQAKHWSEQYKRFLLFSIPVSMSQFENNNFYVTFKKTLEAFDFPEKYLGIRITEKLFVQPNEEISLILKNLAAVGTPISLDDFGVGYSSLNKLKWLF